LGEGRVLRVGDGLGMLVRALEAVGRVERAEMVVRAQMVVMVVDKKDISSSRPARDT
jgi:hypothetical protein